MAWKAEAAELLKLLKEEDLLAVYNHYFKNAPTEERGQALIDKILAKESKPDKFLSRQQFSIDVMRRYMGLNTGSRSVLKSQILQRWGIEVEAQGEEQPMDIPSSDNFATDADGEHSIATSSSSTVLGKRASVGGAGRDSPPAKRNPSLDLTRWWIVHKDDGLYYSGLVNGELHDTERVVENRDVQALGPEDWGRIVTTSGQRYRLGEPLDGQIVEKHVDTFGPWPTPMVGGDAVNLQITRNLGALSMDMRVRLTEGLSGDRIRPLQMSTYLYRLLQIINGLACRDTLLAAAAKLDQPPALTKEKRIRDEDLQAWAESTGVDRSVIEKLEKLNTLFEQIKDESTTVHELLYFKKNYAFERNVRDGGPTSIAHAMNQRKLRVLEAAELRAAQSRKQREETKARERNANAADLRRMRLDEANELIASLHSELETLARDRSRLDHILERLTAEKNQLWREISDARQRVATQITLNGSNVARELFIEMEQLERTKGVVETDEATVREQLQSILDARNKTQRELEKAMKDRDALQG